jgi:hypothetical protein
MIADREAVRVEIGLRLKTVLESTALAQEVFDHLEADFGAKTPVVMMASAGADLAPLTGQGTRSGYLYDLHVYVLYAIEDSPEWTPTLSAQRLDRIYAAIVAFLSSPNNRKTALWQSLKQVSQSLVVTEAIGGAGYWHEIIPIKAEVY